MKSVLFVPPSAPISSCFFPATRRHHAQLQKCPSLNLFRRHVAATVTSTAPLIFMHSSLPPSSTSPPASTDSSSESSSNLDSSAPPEQPPNDGNGNNDESDSSSNDDDDDDDDDDDKPTWLNEPSFNFPMVNESVDSRLNKILGNIFHQVFLFFKYFRSIIAIIFNDVPASVIATIISATATITATRIKASHDTKVSERAREQTRMENKIKTENRLRESYRDLTLPLLKASAKLADRLYQLIDGDLTMVENNQTSDDLLSPLYSTYLMARYFSAVEIMKNEHPLFDYGFPAADRILHNIVGRIQGVFCSNDNYIQSMQQTEQFFKTEHPDHVLNAGLFKLTPRTQVVLGELLWKSAWMKTYQFLTKDKDEHKYSVISFLEFSRIYEQDEMMQKWTQPVVNDFVKLGKLINENENDPHNNRHRRNNDIGARIFFLQSALCDLIDFFDPLPDTRAVPKFRRRRLQLNNHHNHHNNNGSFLQRRPMSLKLLFNELALLRDNRAPGGDPLTRLRLPYGVEAYITSDNGNDDEEVSKMDIKNNKYSKTATRNSRTTGTTTTSPCVKSQQVLMILQEMNIPYKTVTILPKSKPMWYYFLHPDNKTPVIYHDGNVLDDSVHIISYLEKKFPKHPKISTIDNHLNLRPSILTLSKCHTSFVRWLKTSSKQQQQQVESQLLQLDRILKKVYLIHQGRHRFFGGQKFSHEDIALAPYLHHIDIVGHAIKQWSIPSECVALKKYLEAVRTTPSFMKTMPDTEAVIEWYGSIVSKGGLEGHRVCDLLE